MERVDARTNGQAQLYVEYPNEDKWTDGDHDLVCVAKTDARQDQLIGG